MYIRAKDIFSHQNVGSGDGTIWQEPLVDDLEEVMCGGVTNHILNLSSQESLRIHMSSVLRLVIIYSIHQLHAMNAIICQGCILDCGVMIVQPCL